MKIQLQKILHDKGKLLLAILLLLFPAIEALQIMYQVYIYGDSMPYPLYATFLSCYTRGHILHKLYFWFLPLYFLILVGDECIEDYDTGYKNIMIVKMGKRKYMKVRLLSSFLLPFFIVMCSLLLNLAAVCIIFRNGTYIKLSEEGAKPGIYDVVSMPEALQFKLSYTHPLIANLIFMLIAAFLAGLISMAGASFAIAVHDRKIVYAVTFALWFVPVLMKNSSMLVLQPFSEYDFDVLAPIFLWMMGVYLSAVFLSAVWEAKINEI